MDKKLGFVLTAAVLAFSLIGMFPALAAGQEMSAQEKMMMDQMLKYGTPGKNHELFKMYAGTWDVDITTWQSPGAPPVKSKGTMKNEVIFDGRYLKSDFQGEMGEMKIGGLEVIAYDLMKKMYTTFWIDSWSTGFVITTGTLDGTGKILTETGMYPDMMTDGKTMQKVKNVTTFLAAGKYKFEMFMVGSDGRETKGMELLCTRREP